MNFVSETNKLWKWIKNFLIRWREHIRHGNISFYFYYGNLTQRYCRGEWGTLKQEMYFWNNLRLSCSIILQLNSYERQFCLQAWYTQFITQSHYEIIHDFVKFAVQCAPVGDALELRWGKLKHCCFFIGDNAYTAEKQQPNGKIIFMAISYNLDLQLDCIARPQFLGIWVLQNHITTKLEQNACMLVRLPKCQAPMIHECELGAVVWLTVEKKFSSPTKLRVETK